VRIAQDMGLVVGMTGDGVNDATALKRADVGFAMGSGTEVAKEAGDIVILDNRFLSITRAILYGRTIFHSIRKFLVFQLTMNFCAVCVSLIGPFIGVNSPFTVTQMLWINIIIDTLAGLAFAGEAPQRAYMEEPPKSRKEPIITGRMLSQILITGAYTVGVLSVFLSFPSVRARYGFESDFVGFMTAFFTLFVFCGIFNAFNARTSRIRFLANIGKNKGFLLIMAAVSAVQILLVFFGGTTFRTHALRAEVIRDIVLLAFTVIPFDVVRKIFSRIFMMEA
jgi:magnesium-transporting ATPase (P-type)